jgi:pyruvate-formate lyase-activating enzyme
MKTDQGTIHLNSNAYHPPSVLRLRQAGLDSIRISLNSPRAALYNAYYRPKGYDFRQVVQSIRTAVDSGLYTALNLLVFPGITDQEEDVSSLLDLIRTTRVQMLQMRNLSIDPDIYLRLFDIHHGESMGIRGLIRLLQKEFPSLEIGYFNRPRELFGKQLIRELDI